MVGRRREAAWWAALANRPRDRRPSLTVEALDARVVDVMTRPGLCELIETAGASA